MRIVSFALTLLLAFGAGAEAQRLVVEGTSRHPAVSGLKDIVARGEYRVLDRDTVLSEGSLHEGDLVVVDAVVRLEGSVTGSVAVIGGSFFLRPGSSVGGDGIAVAGTIGMSTLATIGDTLFLPLHYGVEVQSTPGEYRVSVRSPPRPPLIRPQGFFGIVLPSYDRVNGATLRLSVTGGVGTDSLRPRFTVVGSYFSARGDVGGRGEAALPLGERTRISVSGGREVFTPDAWIRGDLTNSLSALLAGSDTRNYYESDFGAVLLEWLPLASLRERQGYVAPRVGVVASRDRSLRTRDPWRLFGDEQWRENPPISEGTLTSATAGFTAGWRGMTSALESAADVEWAFRSPFGSSWGEWDFVQLTADGRWSMLALWNHTLTVRGHLVQTLGNEPAPPQRWPLIGGSGTLPTLEQGALRGDNLVFVQSTYAIPLRRVVLPVVGMPVFAARHAVGSAWLTSGETPRWQQNLGLGVRLNVADIFLYLDPAAADRHPTFSVSFHLPR